jgi:hypothetical protein
MSRGIATPPRKRLLARSAIALAALWLMACPGAPSIAAAAAGKTAPAAAAAGLVDEVRRTFTLHGKTIPPEIFRDLGDGDLADSGSIWVTVDIAAAIGSNLYADDIKAEHGWTVQTKTPQNGGGAEETAYRFVGATANGLLVVLASYSGGGSGDFMTLHILDIAAARAFDSDGKIYQRVNLTSVRSVALGDRWDGDVSISKNSIRVVTTRNGPAGGTRSPMSIEAIRP